MEHYIDDVLNLRLDRDLALRKMIREHGAVHQVAQYVKNAIDWDVADLSFGDVAAIQQSQTLAMGLAMFDVSGLLAIFEQSPLVYEKFAQLRMLSEEGQVRPHDLGNSCRRIFDVLDAGIDRGAQLAHTAVGGGEKQVALTGEVAVERPFADAEGVSEELRIGVGITTLGEELGSDIEDLLSSIDRANRGQVGESL